MAIHVVTAYRRPPHIASADRIRSIPLGALLLALSVAGAVLAAVNAAWVLDDANRLDVSLIGIVWVVAAGTGAAMLTRGLPRRAAIAAGFIVLALAGFLSLGVFLYTFRIAVPSETISRVDALVRAAVYWAIFLALAWLGRRLIRGSRHLVLFLRKFGFTSATGQVSGVVQGRTGSSWRAVTLDDSRVAPVGITGRARSVAWLVGGGLAILGGAICFAGYWVAFPDTRLGAGASFLCLLVVVPIVTGIGMSQSTIRARMEAAVVVSRDEAVAPTVKRILQRNRRVLAPRMVVCRVADPQWRSAVLALAQQSDAVLIDVSMPSEAVVWEISALQEMRAQHCVYVCHASAADRLAATDPGNPSYAGQVAALLDGVEVLVYGSDDGTAFATSLRHRLDMAATRRPVTADGVTAINRHADAAGAV